MPAPQHPQIYLATPASLPSESFADDLAAVLDAAPVACLLMRCASNDEAEVTRGADALREVAHARDVPMVIERHVTLAERLGLDGVHLTDGSRSVRKARKTLGNDAIIGAYCGVSRHDGINAGEAGADYVSFGPVGQTALGDGERAELELFAWWSEMIEVPIVAEGALDNDLIDALAPVADFICLGEELWTRDNPVQWMKEVYDRLSAA